MGAALATLFDEKGTVDGKATADLPSRLADAGMRAVGLAGTIGEAVMLDFDDRCELVSSARAAVLAAPQLPSVGHCIARPMRPPGAGVRLVPGLASGRHRPSSPGDRGAAWAAGRPDRTGPCL